MTSAGAGKSIGHRVERWDEFRRRYRQELRDNPSAWQPLVAAGRRGTVTLIYSARDTEHNGAIVLQGDAGWAVSSSERLRVSHVTVNGIAAGMRNTG